jgi:hypothetical protein
MADRHACCAALAALLFCTEAGADARDMTVKVNGRVGAGMAVGITGFVPMALLLSNIETHKTEHPFSSPGGSDLLAAAIQVPIWGAVHVVSGALLIDAHIKSRKMLGLKPFDALNIVGLSLYGVGMVSIGVAGTFAALRTSYSLLAVAGLPWLANLVVGFVMGAKATSNAKEAAAIADQTARPQVLALPSLYEGGAGLTFAGTF